MFCDEFCFIMSPCRFHMVLLFNWELGKFSLKERFFSQGLVCNKWSQRQWSLLCTSAAFADRASWSLSFLLSRRRWRKRACCSLFSCRITAFACRTFSFSACKATARDLLFIWTPFRMLWMLLATGRKYGVNGWLLLFIIHWQITLFHHNS